MTILPSDLQLITRLFVACSNTFEQVTGRAEICERAMLVKRLFHTVCYYRYAFTCTCRHTWSGDFINGKGSNSALSPNNKNVDTVLCVQQRPLNSERTSRYCREAQQICMRTSFTTQHTVLSNLLRLSQY